MTAVLHSGYHSELGENYQSLPGYLEFLQPGLRDCEEANLPVPAQQASQPQLTRSTNSSSSRENSPVTGGDCWSLPDLVEHSHTARLQQADNQRELSYLTAYKYLLFPPATTPSLYI